jgi:hypothetical protein
MDSLSFSATSAEFAHASAHASGISEGVNSSKLIKYFLVNSLNSIAYFFLKRNFFIF